MPVKCDNSPHIVFDVKPINHNWTPFYFRCTRNKETQSKRFRDKIRIEESFVTKELFYNHVFKAAGTTIQRGLERLSSSHKLINLTTFPNTTRHVYTGGKNAVLLNNLLSLLDKSTMSFTFVRDPIQKFLSGFYEANRRYINDGRNHSRVPMWNQYKRLKGIDIMRGWIKIMIKKNKFIDSHTFPNHRHLREQIPFNYIGDIKHLEDDILQILSPLMIGKELNSNFFMKYFGHERNRYSTGYLNGVTVNANKFSVNRSELTDQDIRQLCEIYYLDYMCFPFEIPKQCDVHDLFNNHYGIDVTYQSCF